MGINATYDMSTGVISIPAILVGDQIWSVQLLQDSPSADTFTLLMDSVALNTAVDPSTVDTSLLASFNANNGKLDVPVFYVGQDQWRVRMKLVGIIPSPTFEVTIVNPGVGNLDDDESNEAGERSGRRNRGRD